MYVIIAGGGRTGAQLARVLISQNQDVHLVENRRDVLSRIHRELPTESIHEGNPIDPMVLEQAGIKKADVLAATTTIDEVNLVLCYIAHERYNVRRTIEEEMSMGDMMTLLKLRRGNYSLVEEKVPEGAQAIGVPIKDLGLPDHCVVAAIIRKGEVIVPRGVMTFEAGDEVLAVTDTEGAHLLGRLLLPAGNAVAANTNSNGNN